MIGTHTLTIGHFRILAVIVRATLGLLLLGAVADRFGILGAPGSDGVSWGSFPAFVDYTRTLLPGPLRDFATVAGIAATVLEVALGIGLVCGVSARVTELGAAGLLAIFAWGCGPPWDSRRWPAARSRSSSRARHCWPPPTTHAPAGAHRWSTSRTPYRPDGTKPSEWYWERVFFMQFILMTCSQPEFGDRVVFQRVGGADVAMHGARVGPPALSHDLAVRRATERGLGRKTRA